MTRGPVERGRSFRTRPVTGSASSTSGAESTVDDGNARSLEDQDRGGPTSSGVAQAGRPRCRRGHASLDTCLGRRRVVCQVGGRAQGRDDAASPSAEARPAPPPRSRPPPHRPAADRARRAMARAGSSTGAGQGHAAAIPWRPAADPQVGGGTHLVPRNVADAAHIPHAAPDAAEKRAFTWDELDALLRSAGKRSLRSVLRRAHRAGAAQPGSRRARGGATSTSTAVGRTSIEP